MLWYLTMFFQILGRYVHAPFCLLGLYVYSIFLGISKKLENIHRPLGPRRNRWAACKASKLLTDPGKVVKSNHPLVCLGGYIDEAHFECHAS